MTGATFIDLTGAFQIRMGDRDVMTIAPGAAFQFRQRVNLATNPSFETASGTPVVVRTNLSTSPRMTTLQPAYGGGTRTAVTNAPATPGGTTTANRVTWPDNTVNPTGAGFTFLSVQPGESRRILALARAVDRPVPVAPAVASVGVGPVLTLTADQWSVIDWTATNTHTAAQNLGIRAASTELAIAGGFYVTEVLLAVGGDIGSYFDGATSPDADLTPAWTGAVDASTSTLSGIPVATVGLGTAFATRFSSTRWAASGSRSLRVVTLPGGSAIDWFAHLNMPVDSLRGRTIRASAICHREAAQANPSPTYSGRMQVRGSGGVIFANGASAPNAPGDHLLTITWTLPANTDSATHMLRLYNGAPVGDADVWWDDLLIEDVTDAAPAEASFFSGDTPDSPEALHHWTGPANASTSAATQAWGS